MTPEQAAALRAPFAPEQIGKLPKGGTTLDYVGHAAVTDRLLSVDREWCWEPDRMPDGRWDVGTVGTETVLTGTLTVCGVSRPCVGIASTKSFELHKQLQSDAIRNGAMRFGVALDLWSKEDITPSSPPSAGDVMDSSDAKRELLAVCRSLHPVLDDAKAAAKAAWADRQTITHAEMADLVDGLT